MTWLKLGEEFPVELAKLHLSDAAFRTHVEGLSYSLDRESDGVLADTEVRRFAETTDYGAAVQELVDHGLWIRIDGGFRIVHHMEHQPTAAYLADERSNAARRKQREREKKALLAAGYGDEETEVILKQRGLAPKGSKKSTSHRDMGRDFTREMTRDPERSGTERNGSERSGKKALEEEAPSSSYSDSPSNSSAALWSQDQAWLNREAAPVGDDPNKCTSPRCGGRVTDYNRSQGIRQCNDCLSRAAPL